MAKNTHTYNCGDEVTFKFFDGSTHTGKITHLTYQGDNVDSIKTNFDIPTYKIQVNDLGKSNNKKGFTVYPCMTESRIIKRDKTAMKVMKEFDQAYRDKMNKERNSAKAEAKKTDNTSELDAAIEEQKKFINREL